MSTWRISVNLCSVAFLASWREVGTAILVNDLTGDVSGVRTAEKYQPLHGFLEALRRTLT
ncbi:hypothetical protein [Nisaea sp.]|uniref:hypothetical protein n=1 Tax=Nisaea sp. TaxID=2024842 RepID=UPI002B26C299|nr:hypothetical protein [Nisaea sp.]